MPIFFSLMQSSFLSVHETTEFKPLVVEKAMKNFVFPTELKLLTCE